MLLLTSMALEALSVLLVNKEPGCRVSRDSGWLAAPPQESLKASTSLTPAAAVLGVEDEGVAGDGGVV